MTVKLKCPVCGSMGSLMQKTTKTKTTTGEYKEYRYWYIYHGKKAMKPWCYLTKEDLNKPEIKEALRKSTTQITTQTTQKSENPKLASKSENTVSGGVRVWSKETGLGPVGVGLRGFKSRPPHHSTRFIVKPVNKQHVHI